MASPSLAAVSGDRKSRLSRVPIVALSVFCLSAAATIYFSQTMAGSMAMAGGWSMSAAWMRMGSWSATAAMFCLMWTAMMVFMMLPSTLPVLMLTQRSLRFRGESHYNLLTTTVAAAYFAVWTGFGLLVFGLGSAMAQAAMSSERFSRWVPLLTGMAIMVAGGFQLSPAKSACLRHCRDPLLLVAHLRPGWFGCFRLGIHHGLFCAGCCWALMLIQSVLGVMSLPLMVVIALVIAWEKLSASSVIPARIAGVAAISFGLLLVLHRLRAG